MRRSISRSAIILALLIALFGATAPSGASADVLTVQDTRCDSDSLVGDLCLWWGLNLETSALIGISLEVCDLGLLRYPDNGQGGGQLVENNVSVIRNNDSFTWVTIFFNPCGPGGARPTGPSQAFAPGQQRNCVQMGQLCRNIRAIIWG